MTPDYDIVDPRFAGLLDTGKPPERIAQGHTWTEGPVWIEDTLYFNDIPARRMLGWQEGRGVGVVLPDSEFANGNTRDAGGAMISCEHGGRRVVRRPDRHRPAEVEVLASHWQGKRLNSPNDVVVHRDGSVWFTDPPYGINSDVEGYPAESEIGGNHVYRIGTDGEVRAVATDFDKPNGLAFSPDQSRLYIADSGAILGASFPGLDRTRPHHLRVFDVRDGRLHGGEVFHVVEPGVPDGLRVDTGGLVWCSAEDGIHCLDEQARLLGKIRLPSQTSNLCFGGPSGTDLFITSSDSVYRVRTSRRDAAA